MSHPARPEAPSTPGYPVRRIFAALLAVSAVMVLTALFEPWWSMPHDLRVFLDVSNEISLPTWWNTSLLVLAGVLMLTAAGAVPDRGERTSWRLLGGLLVLMSLDEASMLHERLALVGSFWWPDAGLNYMWLLLGVPLAGAVILFVVVAVRGLPGTARWTVLGAFGTYFLGAVGAELAQEAILHAEASGRVHWFARRFLAHLEEGLEMTGAALLLVAPLARLRRPLAAGGPGGSGPPRA